MAFVSETSKNPSSFNGTELYGKLYSGPNENIDLEASLLSRKITTEKNSSLIPETTKLMGPIFPTDRNLTNILILSATGRSGSSFFSEIMSATPSTFYFSEPRHLMPHFTDRESFVNSIRNLFSCDFSSLDFNNEMSPYYILRHTSTHHCTVSPLLCEKQTRQYFEQQCLSSTRRVLKTIAIPLSWIRERVEETKENAKFIHLIRDPRPTLMSAKKAEFGLNNESICKNMNEASQFDDMLSQKNC